MSDADNRLATEAEDVQRRFADHPHISIVSTEGKPVNKYVIEYRLQGLVRLDDGEIARSDQHRVEISLSFGFPHFPPNCKPLTQIFHPDIDPSAIKIADFWSTEESMVSLIIHIGRLICWQLYSDENVFNQEAAAWLVEHGKDVPLDSVDLAAEPEQGVAPAAPEAPAVSGDVSGDLELDLDAEEMPELAFETVELGGEQSAPAAPEATGGAEQEIDFVGHNSEVARAEEEGQLPDIAKDLDFSFQAPADSAPRESASAADDDKEIEGPALPHSGEMPEYEVEGEVDLDFATVDVDYDILRGMMDQGNYFAAQRKIEGMAAENISEAVAALRPDIEKHIRQAEKAFQEAQELEAQELLEEAARKFEAVLNIARDYPGLEDRMKRVRNAWVASMGDGDETVAGSDKLEIEEVELYDLAADQEIVLPGAMSLSLESSEAQQGEPEPEEAAPSAAKEFVPPEVADSLIVERSSSSPAAGRKKEGAPAMKATEKPPRQAGKDTEKPSKSKKIFVVAAVVILVLALSGWTLMEWTSLKKATEKWNAVHPLLQQGEYHQVNQHCQEIIALLDRVQFVLVSDKKKLLAQVDDIISSEHFQEAIGGKVYYQDKYISKMAHAAYLEIGKLLAAGEKAASVGDWQEALAHYSAALDVAEENKKRLDEKFYEQVLFRVKQAQFADNVAQGKKAFVAKQWPTAIKHLQEALELAALPDVAEPATRSDVNRSLQQARFSQLIREGDDFLEQGKWQEAVSRYQGAHDIARQSNVIDKARAESVTLKLQQTTLVKSVTAGDAFSTAGKWVPAVQEYEKAAAVLPYDVTLPGLGVAATRERVAGSLLTALYNKERQEAQAYLQEGHYDKAVAALQRAVSAVEDSPLKSTAKWQLLKKEAEEELEKASLQGVIDEKTAYLYAHYQEFFVKNFDGVRAKTLSQPRVTFLEASGNALIFRIRCRELRDLKYYTLELIYQYDMARDQWGFQGS
ncbi:MAG: hypothetical protein C0613_09715 [Desulfobulbaceae bacterium]|nr:MAG: hypothetical protein C0613_09715 [Desulfobulbaceae bacterium]